MRASVTSKGQVTIPKVLREKMGIRHGSRIEFVQVDGHIELRIEPVPAAAGQSGFGMLKSPLPSMPSDLDSALLARRRSRI